MDHPTWMSEVGKAFRERFAHSPDTATFTPLGFFDAGAEWERSRGAERIRELEAGLRHAQYIAQEISTIAEHSGASGVDDGRNHPLSIAERLREIVELVDAEIIDGPSPITAALAGGDDSK